MSKVLWGPMLLLRLTLGHRHRPCVQHREGKAAPVPNPGSLSELQTDIQTGTQLLATMGRIVAQVQCSALAELHQPLCPPNDNPRRELLGHFHELWHFSVLPAGGSPLGASYSIHQPLLPDLAKHLKPSPSAEILVSPVACQPGPQTLQRRSFVCVLCHPQPLEHCKA